MRCLKEYHRVTYTNLLTSGKLNSYLAGIDWQAKEMFSRQVKEYADRQEVTEQLKSDKPLDWGVCGLKSVTNEYAVSFRVVIISRN